LQQAHSNAECEERSSADAKNQDNKCYWIVIEPVPKCLHEAPPNRAFTALVALGGKAVQSWQGSEYMAPCPHAPRVLARPWRGTAFAVRNPCRVCSLRREETLLQLLTLEEAWFN